MPYYMLATYSREGEARPSMTDEEMHASWQQIGVLEAEMKANDSWVFSGRLHEPSTATVVRVANGEVLMTDGPFAESKDHLGGFYIIQARDLDAALEWASKVTAVVGHPLETTPFVDAQTG
jgi:hypothetical protein